MIIKISIAFALLIATATPAPAVTELFPIAPTPAFNATTVNPDDSSLSTVEEVFLGIGTVIAFLILCCCVGACLLGGCKDLQVPSCNCSCDLCC